MRVVQYGVHDPAYPRNARLRSFFLERLGAEVVVLERSRVRSRARRVLGDLVALWQRSRGADVIVLSEFRLTQAPVAWAVARLRRARLVVDHFVGLHETVVDDWAEVSHGSLRARRLALQDAFAARVADICLTDTTVRAERLEATHGRPVIALPVGSPSWARPIHTADQRADDALRILYYGNYIPLHGVDEIVRILAALEPLRSFAATFIGGGVQRARIERAVAAAGIADHVTFLDAVPERELAEHIGAADVVLGVFGSSRKACEVVPNKVWQGLACGKVTVTGDGPTVRELVDVVGAQLVLVDRADPVASARRIISTVVSDGASRSHERLERFTGAAYERLAIALLDGRRS